MKYTQGIFFCFLRIDFMVCIFFDALYLPVISVGLSLHLTQNMKIMPSDTFCLTVCATLILAMGFIDHSGHDVRCFFLKYSYMYIQMFYAEQIYQFRIYEYYFSRIF